MRILDLGCGKNRRACGDADVVWVDSDPDSNATIIHDLNEFPYPFRDSEFDRIWCYDILEHLINIPLVMKELHRVGKAGACLTIRSPHFSSAYAAMDPTHLRSFSVFSWDGWCVNKRITPHHVDEALFAIRKSRIVFPRLTRVLGIGAVLGRFPLRYEQYLAFVIQAESVYLELEVAK